ncbi:phosphorylcholine transferase LicD [Dellaglioa sp. P0083]|uniref:LicD family protein n=1 Tax=Dellaglioa kimchii TaxID=3344667 RepID=UPI0038D4A16D
MKIEELHKVELDLIQEVVEICQKNNIKYFMIGGSLLGAVRHQGFIPWDDDVDIGMVRDDYDRFLQIAPQEISQPYYFLQTDQSDPNYAFGYAKLLDESIHVEEKRNINDARKGVFVDIFPFDKVPTGDVERSIQQSKYRYLNAKILLLSNYRLMDTEINAKIRKLQPDQSRKTKEYKEKRDELVRTYNQDDTISEYKNLASQYSYEKELLSEKELADVIQVPFENLTVTILSAYDAILSRLYGDYLQLPPESKQIEKHIEKVTILDRNDFTFDNEID